MPGGSYLCDYGLAGVFFCWFLGLLCFTGVVWCDKIKELCRPGIVWYRNGILCSGGGL